MKKDTTVYLRHILDAIGRIERYLEGVDRKDFLADDLLQAGVIRELEIVGEAAQQVGNGFRRGHPEIPWKKMTGMRDKLVHDYLGVDLEAVWETVKKDLPELKKELQEIVSNR